MMSLDYMFPYRRISTRPLPLEAATSLEVLAVIQCHCEG